MLARVLQSDTLRSLMIVTECRVRAASYNTLVVFQTMNFQNSFTLRLIKKFEKCTNFKESLIPDFVQSCCAITKFEFLQARLGTKLYFKSCIFISVFYCCIQFVVIIIWFCFTCGDRKLRLQKKSLKGFCEGL